MGHCACSATRPARASGGRAQAYRSVNKAPVCRYKGGAQPDGRRGCSGRPLAGPARSPGAVAYLTRQGTSARRGPGSRGCACCGGVCVSRAAAPGCACNRSGSNTTAKPLSGEAAGARGRGRLPPLCAQRGARLFPEFSRLEHGPLSVVGNAFVGREGRLPAPPCWVYEKFSAKNAKTPLDPLCSTAGIAQPALRRPGHSQGGGLQPALSEEEPPRSHCSKHKLVSKPGERDTRFEAPLGSRQLLRGLLRGPAVP